MAAALIQFIIQHGSPSARRLALDRPPVLAQRDLPLASRSEDGNGSAAAPRHAPTSRFFRRPRRAPSRRSAGHHRPERWIPAGCPAPSHDRKRQEIGCGCFEPCGDLAPGRVGGSLAVPGKTGQNKPEQTKTNQNKPKQTDLLLSSGWESCGHRVSAALWRQWKGSIKPDQTLPGLPSPAGVSAE